MAKTKAGKKDLDTYTIKGTNKIVRPGDCVLIRPSESDKLPYVARVEKLEADHRSNVKVRLRWYYRPEDSLEGRKQFHGAKELFLSDHYDVQSALTIEGKCIVHSFINYTKLENDPSKSNDLDALFDQARQTGGVERHGDRLQLSSSSRSFSGTARLLTGETISTAPSHPETVTHNIAFWTNGFTVDDGPLRRIDDPENASLVESIRNSECPQELAPADVRTVVHVNLTRKEQECCVPKKRHNLFQGQGRTLGSNNDAVPPVEQTVTSNLQSAPPPSMGLVVWIRHYYLQPQYSSGWQMAPRMVSRFNFHHTVRDIRGFIDASRPAAPRSYHLQTVGFPPKQLTNLDRTIEEAGLANSVYIQKL